VNAASVQLSGAALDAWDFARVTVYPEVTSVWPTISLVVVSFN
jgi:hypothetical protein